MLSGSNIVEQVRSRKTLALAMAGGILGVAASVMAYHYLEREESQFRQEILAKQSQNLAEVVVAKRDLAVGAEIGEANMAMRKVPQDYVYAETVLPENFDKVRGQTLIKALGKGQPLLSSYLSGGGVAGLADKVEEGRRAVTINVDEVSSINGMIHPGDRVDLLFSGRGAANGSSVTPLLQNVKVLATGGQYAPANGQAGQDKFGLSYATLTLDVAPEEATRIILARETGVLTTVLRARGDQRSDLPAAPLTSALLFGAVAPTGGKVPRAPFDTVTYIMRGEMPGVAISFELPVGEVHSMALPDSESKAPAAGANGSPAKTRQVSKGTDKQ